ECSSFVVAVRAPLVDMLYESDPTLEEVPPQIHVHEHGRVWCRCNNLSRLETSRTSEDFSDFKDLPWELKEVRGLEGCNYK
ncbi:hypothetical protein H0E87_014614, partial [Populus deltoides]